MRVAVIQFPGTNCEYETLVSVKSVEIDCEIFRWNRPADELLEFDGFIIPGGFSYQDRVRAGVIASKKPIMKAIMKKAEDGCPVLGICNGAQVLIESGIVPGIEWTKVEMALTFNRWTGFFCDWIYLKVWSKKSPFFSLFSIGDVFPIPIAHGEGRFVTQKEGLLDRLIRNEQVALRYCTEDGEIIDEFPINPNGSVFNIAGITNKEGNVLAMMPHPERASFAYHKSSSGIKIFEGMKFFKK
ncbi:TPA: phosphoribosylformylglycinamidine synthase [bacterium]|nr:phosphoribosylformylglycinamidine synthase [bacterium]